MSVWLPGVARDESIQGKGGGSFTGGPSKIVLHTTEGGWEGSMGVFRSRLTAPHVMAAPPSHRDGPRIAQFIPLDRSGYALKNDPGGPDTNRDSVLQVEIVGNAHDSPNWPESDLVWIGEHVVAPLVKHAVSPINLDHHPRFYGEDCGWTLATPSARQRMSDSAWDAFDGICGHQHVGEGNAHWDPGGLDIDRIVRAAKGRRPMTPEVRAMLLAAADAEAADRPTLKVTTPLTVGHDVRDAQSLLSAPVTGRYGPGTAKRAEAFQTFFRLPVDGVVGRRTWETLLFIGAARYLGY